jgi:hypothetical protein
LNYHESELLEFHSSILYNLVNPISSLKSRLDLYYYRSYAAEVQDLGVDVQRFGAVRDIHEKLNNLLGERRTFFDK